MERLFYIIILISNLKKFGQYHNINSMKAYNAKHKNISNADTINKSIMPSKIHGKIHNNLSAAGVNTLSCVVRVTKTDNVKCSHWGS